MKSLLYEDSSKVLKKYLREKISSVLATRALFVTDASRVLRGSVNEFPKFINADTQS